MPPTEQQMLQAEHENLLNPEEQQALNELRDVGGIGPALAVTALRERGATSGVKRMQPLGTAPPVAPPVETPPAPPEASVATQPASPTPGLGQALWDSLGAGGRRAEAMVGDIADDPMAYLRSVLAMTQGPEGLMRGIAGGALEPAKYAFPPALAGEVAGGTGMRMAGGTPDQVRAAEEAGGVVGGGLATVGPSLLRGGAWLASPTLRGQNKVTKLLTSSRNSQLAAEEAQLAEQAAAGGAAGPVIANIRGRLVSEASKRAKTARQYEEQFSPQTIKQYEELQAAPPQEVTATGQLVRAPKGSPKPLTEKDYSRNILELRESNTRAGDMVMALDRQLDRRLKNIGDVGRARVLARDPDLVTAIRLHASPEEMTVIERAVASGKPLSKIALTEEETIKIGQAMQAGRGILSPIVHWGIGGAGLGYLGIVGGLVATGGAPVVLGAGTMIAARLGLKALDAAIASRAGAAGLRGLAQMQPGTQDVARALGALGGELGGPLKLEPKD